MPNEREQIEARIYALRERYDLLDSLEGDERMIELQQIMSELDDMESRVARFKNEGAG